MAELEQFCILAQKQKGRACEALIQQVLNNKKIFVFSELLSVPSVGALRETEYERSYYTLELFAFGRYSDFQGARERYIDLSEAQQKKLKQLTLCSLAGEKKILSYQSLQKELKIDNLRNLEDLIIDTIYLGLISGKIDQRKALFRVKDSMARDVRPENLNDIISILEEWHETCSTLLVKLEESSRVVQQRRSETIVEQQETQLHADKLKAALKESMAAGDSAVGEVGDYADDDDCEDDTRGLGSLGGYRGSGGGGRLGTVRSMKRNRFASSSAGTGRMC